MAPERYEGVFRSQSSDVFAVGVIAAELLLARHPCGSPVETVGKWKSEKMQRWGKSGDRKLDEIPWGEVRNLIHACLASDPTSRPNPDEIVETISDSLKRYFDIEVKPTLDLWTNESLRRIGNSDVLTEAWAAAQAASVSSDSRDHVIADLSRKLGQSPDRPDILQIAAWGITAAALVPLLQSRNTADDQRKLQELSHCAVALIKDKLSLLGLEDVIAARTSGSDTLVPATRPFETLSQVVGRCVSIMEATIPEDEILSVVSGTNTLVRSAYHFHCACVFHEKGSEDPYPRQKLEQLEICIRINPSEATFYFFKGLWLQGIRLIETMAHEKTSAISTVEIRAAFERAHELEPDWIEPFRELESMRTS